MPKAIQTRYKGFHFRSRLEARWAVAFDSFGITWEYEKEGFDLDADGAYLPDFWLPQTNQWAEIKGRPFNDAELNKAIALADHTSSAVLLLSGPPEPCSYWAIHGSEAYEGSPWVQTTADGRTFTAQDQLIFSESKTHLSQRAFFGVNAPNGAFPRPFRVDLSLIDSFPIEAARSARFEHGEKPNFSEQPTEKFTHAHISYDELLTKVQEAQGLPAAEFRHRMSQLSQRLGSQDPHFAERLFFAADGPDQS